MGYEQLCPSGAVSARTVAEERHSLRQIAILDLDPPAIDRSLCPPVRKTLLGREGEQLCSLLIQRYIVSDEPKRYRA